MSVCFSRAALIVNEETPMSYLLDCTLGMMLSNGADTHLVFRPSLAATPSNRSTSKPLTVLPLVSRNSFGAYVESVPIVIVPLDFRDAGSMALSAASAPPEEEPEALAAADVPADDEELFDPPDELEPHAASPAVRTRDRAATLVRR